MTKRLFTGTGVDMVTACATIMENAIENKTFLIDKRPAWVDPFFETTYGRLQSVASNVLGIDNLARQRQATQIVVAMLDNVTNDLSEFKVQVGVDFGKDKARLSEVLNTLGFKAYYAKACKKEQQASVQLLYHFKNNLTPELREEITGKGIDAGLIDRITAYTDTLAQANITQETIKSGRKELTGDALAQLNDIYTEVIGIAKIAHNFYKGKPAMQEKFSYAGILKRFGTSAPKKEAAK